MTLQDSPMGGWKLVPVEPTKEMLDAYWHQCGESEAMRDRTHSYGKRYYAAMLAASPAVPSSVEAVREIREDVARALGHGYALGEDALEQIAARIDAALSSPDGAVLHGPFGWLNGHRDLAEDSWTLDNDPLEGSDEFFAVPLYALTDPFKEVASTALSRRSAVTDEMVEAAAKAVEKATTQAQYGWSDEQFDVWWTKAPLFIERVNGWGYFTGTAKAKLLWKTRIALEAALSRPSATPSEEKRS